MKAYKFLLVIAVLFTLGTSTSCTKQDVSEEQAELEAIRKDEIKEQDVM